MLLYFFLLRVFIPKAGLPQGVTGFARPNKLDKSIDYLFLNHLDNFHCE